MPKSLIGQSYRISLYNTAPGMRLPSPRQRAGRLLLVFQRVFAIDLSRNGNTASASHSITVSLPGSRRAPASLSGIVLDPTVLKTLDPEVLEAHLDILRAGNDGSLKYLQAIALLESVLAEMRPEKPCCLQTIPIRSIQRHGYRIIWRRTLSWY